MTWPEALLRLLSRERRRGWRKQTRIPALIPLPKGPTLPVEVTEASPRGFRIRSPRKLAPGRPLELVLQGRPPNEQPLVVPIEIRWNRRVSVGLFAYRCGGRFGHLLDPERYELAVRLLGSTGLIFSQASEKRRSARLAQESGIGESEMVVLDISAIGVGLLSWTNVPVGDKVDLELNLDGPVRCAGTVVWNQPSRDARFHHLGVRFDPVDEDLQSRLVTSIEAMIRVAQDDQDRRPGL